MLGNEVLIQFVLCVCVSEMAEAVETASAVPHEELSRAGPSSDSLALEADERRQEELRKRNRDPPIVYTDIDVSTNLFENAQKGSLNHDMYMFALMMYIM